MNNVKTALLLGLMSGLLLVAGEALGGEQGLLMALVFAVGLNLISYFFSDKIALASYGAQQVTPDQHPEVYRRLAPLVNTLCARMGLPMPKLWVLPEEAPNAFATGRNPKHASVAVTYGLLELMTDRELEAVIAHELGHVQHRDILLSSIAATLASALTVLARLSFFSGGHRDEREGNAGGGLLMLFVAPIAAMLIQFAISRTREYAADEAAARNTGGSAAMIQALQKLEAYSKRIPLEANPATAHMFIIAPFTGGPLLGLFRTHPATEDRIAALQQLR